MQMQIGLRKPARTWIVGVLLFTLSWRGLIPAGFMPSGDRPFTVEICPEGFPAQMLVHAGHHDHGAGHSYSEHCVFGTACATGPPSHFTTLLAVSRTQLGRPMSGAALRVMVQLVYLPHSRGPPATA
jgi:hypothetical protein